MSVNYIQVTTIIAWCFAINISAWKTIQQRETMIWSVCVHHCSGPMYLTYVWLCNNTLNHVIYTCMTLRTRFPSCVMCYDSYHSKIWRQLKIVLWTTRQLNSLHSLMNSGQLWVLVFLITSLARTKKRQDKFLSRFNSVDNVFCRYCCKLWFLCCSAAN